MASPPVIVNHSVVRAGTPARATAAGLAAYAGTRRGVVIEVGEADGRRLGVDGLAAYAANRTGSTGGLWGADGPVPVAEARRASTRASVPASRMGRVTSGLPSCDWRGAGLV